MSFSRKVWRFLRTVSRDTFPEDLAGLLESGRWTDEFYGMNRQYLRAAIILKLSNQLPVDAFVETGTFRGDTCMLIAAQTRLPVFSCEIDRSNYEAAKRRLLFFGKRIELSNEESEQFLTRILSKRQFKAPLVYLDAHWHEELPLRAEINKIVAALSNFVIVIDDFKVPADPGFGYDIYGETILELDYILPGLSPCRDPISVFYPSYPSSRESGSCRGWGLLATSELSEQIQSLVPETLLRREPPGVIPLSSERER